MEEEEEKENIDLFADMAPKIRKQKKVFIGKGKRVFAYNDFFMFMNNK